MIILGHLPLTNAYQSNKFKSHIIPTFVCGKFIKPTYWGELLGWKTNSLSALSRAHNIYIEK